jgi:hypothetical protein
MDGRAQNLAGADRNGGHDAADWTVDVQRTNVTGEVDIGQLEFNLALTPRQRIEQNDGWVEFIQIARTAGQRLYAKQSSFRNRRLKSGE